MCVPRKRFLKTIEGNNIKLGMVTTSDMRMYHVLIALTLTFMQAHTGFKHENNRFSIISKIDISNVQAIPNTFAVKIV